MSRDRLLNNLLKALEILTTPPVCAVDGKRIHPPMIELLSHVCLILKPRNLYFYGAYYDRRFQLQKYIIFWACHVWQRQHSLNDPNPHPLSSCVCGCARCLVCVALSDTVSPRAISHSSLSQLDEREKGADIGTQETQGSCKPILMLLI